MRLCVLSRHFVERRSVVRLLRAGVGAAVAMMATASGPQGAGAQECLFTVNRITGSIAVIRRSANAVVGSFPVADCEERQCQLTALEMTAAGTRGFAIGQAVSTVFIFDAMTQRVIDAIALQPQSSPTAALLSRDERTLYVANFARQTVSAIDTGSDSVVGTIAVGDQPRALALTPDGATLLVANAGGSVSVVRTADDTVIDTIQIGGAPAGIAVAPNGARAYVNDYLGARVNVIDLITRSVAGTIAVGRSPWSIALLPNGTRGFVANVLDNTVSVIDPVAETTIGEPIPVGINPIAVLVTPDAATAYVANSGGSNSISVIDTATRAVTTIPNVPAPFDLALGSCPPIPASCTGDCNGDGQVAVNELIVGVNIALGNQAVGACPALDTDGDGMVVVSELVRAVGFALNGCPS